MMSTINFLRLYFVIGILYLVNLYLGHESINMILKSLLIPMLITAVYLQSRVYNRYLLISALLCSWMGDVWLLFEHKAQIYFILGLGSFLISHLLYIIYFILLQRYRSYRSTPLIVMACIVCMVYLIGLLSHIWAKLGSLQIPVSIYALAISSMLLMAYRGVDYWPYSVWIRVSIGAVIFVISDSLIAIDKFYIQVPESAFWIMSTYISAQYMIVSGLLKFSHKAMK